MIIARRELRRFAEQAIARVMVEHGIDDDHGVIKAVRQVSRETDSVACGGMCAYDKDAALVVDCLVRQAGYWQDFTQPSEIVRALGLAWDEVGSRAFPEQGGSFVWSVSSVG